MIKNLRKLIKPRNVVIIIFVIGIVGFLYLFSLLQLNFEKAEVVKISSIGNFYENKLEKYELNNHLPRKKDRQARQRGLVFLQDSKNQLGKDIIQLIESVRYKYHVQLGDIRNLPVLIDDNKGRYAVIIFEDIFMYLNLNDQNRKIIDNYARDYNVGMISFTQPTPSDDAKPSFHDLGDLPLRVVGGFSLKNYELNPSSTMLRIARAGEIWDQCLKSGSNVFKFSHSTYLAVSYAAEIDHEDFSRCGRKDYLQKSKNWKNVQIFNFDDAYNHASENKDVRDATQFVTVVQDTGKFDGIQRVFFGSDLEFWLHKILFLDALGYASHDRMILPLDRFIQIDIDDIFVGPEGNRMKPDDVTALVSFQENMRKIIPGFTFHLGFSGKFIYSGNPEEDEGDKLFLKLHNHFSWFPHMWSHMQAHRFNNATKLAHYMNVNRQFAIRWNLNTSSQYAVAPHHAGVYPVHEQLYECWRKVWNITSTSTEEYPHLRPDFKRRGFIYKGIKVLPRQTCGLFTHTIFHHLYPGGPEALDSLINGGSLFLSFLFNQFNIYMTHLSNYGNDRLALFTFDHAVKFVRRWTNLKLRYVEPKVMAEKYFRLYLDEVNPVWLNPCVDKRHFEIWSEEKNCNHFPDFVVVGPQKTGTTALYWFLNMHPRVKSNKPSTITFEEIQFFSGKNYMNGIDWYMDFFDISENESILFEKSATYFDQSVVPQRLNALLPKSSVVVILIDPGKRAYSWYQHMRSHENKAALQYSFDEVVKARRKNSSPALISLQTRCLDPGFYADHLERWLEFFEPLKISVIDGELLKSDPAQVMEDLQTSLGFKQRFDYKKVLKFDDKKGFYCQLLASGKTKCLGSSKGRKYPEMMSETKDFLRNYYATANTKLVRLLKSINKPVPSWLEGL